MILAEMLQNTTRDLDIFLIMTKLTQINLSLRHRWVL